MSAALALALQPSWTAAMSPLAPAAKDAWISYARALQLCDRTVQWLRQEVRNGNIQARESSRKLPNGSFERECLVSTLPAHARKRYETEQSRLALPTQASLPLFNTPQLVKAAPRVRLAPAKSTEAERKAQILADILAVRNPHACRIFAQTRFLFDGSPVNSQNRAIQYAIEQRSLAGETLSIRTIKRWIAAHDKEGIAGLGRRKRSDAGRSQYFDKPENRKAAWLVAYLYLGDSMTPGLSVQACYDMLTLQRTLVGIGEADLPHYNTVRNLLATITPALKAYAKCGRKEYGERMLPYLSRAHSEPANQIWVSDTMIADVEVMNDCFGGAKMGEPIRLRLTAIIDYRSRYLVGYSWAWEGSSASIASALRMAVSQHGPCELMYVDNGKDFVKVAAGAMPGYVQPGDIEGWKANEMRRIEQTGVLGRLGIRVTHCIPHHPQSKHIERFFRTLHLTFCKYWRTYTGGKPSERPDNTAALMVHHRKMLAAGTLQKSHHPLASEFMQVFEQWVDQYHAHRGHRGQGMNLRSPAEVFAQERNPNQKPTPAAEDLAWLLWDMKRPIVHECQVRVNKRDYAPLNPIQAQRMFELNEQCVTVAYDPLDPAMVAVLDDDNRLITMLEAKHLVRMAPDDPETQKQIAQMAQMRGQLTRTVREQRLGIIKAGKQIGAMHPIELLAAAGSTEAMPAAAELAASRITPRKPRPEDTIHRAPMYANDLAARMFARQQERKK